MTPTQQFYIQLVIQIGVIIGVVLQSRAQVEKLKSRITALEADNAEKEARIQVLEADNERLRTRMTSLQKEYTQALKDQARGRGRF